MSTRTATIERPLKTAEVADMYGVDRKTVERWARDGKIPCFHTRGGHYRFHLADVRAAMEHDAPDEA